MSKYDYELTMEETKAQIRKETLKLEETVIKVDGDIYLNDIKDILLNLNNLIEYYELNLYIYNNLK